MSTLIDRYRARRTFTRRSRAIERALHASPSHQLREELLAIANRYE